MKLVTNTRVARSARSVPECASPLALSPQAVRPPLPHRQATTPSTVQPSAFPTAAFTLLELLMVVAITGILAALLLPALNLAKSSVRGASCKSHLHQAGLALQMYVHDSQNKYPYYLGPAGPSYGDQTGPGGRAVGLVYWSSKLFPYYPLNWTNVAWQCPGYHGAISGPEIPGAIDRSGSYAYNTAGVRTTDQTNENFGLGPVMFWKDESGKYLAPVAESEISVPDEMLAVGDALMKTGLAGGDDLGRCGGPFGGELQTAPYVLPHGQNYNTLLCDGHVAAMRPGILFNPSNTAAMWNYDHQPHPELWTPQTGRPMVAKPSDLKFEPNRKP